jgi:CTP synthase
LTKFIFVTGGVTSSLGKGIAASSLAALLQARGYSVRLRKLDPYLNVDPGTMSPFQHGEVYVTEDGTETDLDLGHYERFTGVCARASDSTTTGKIYSAVLAKERRGDYLGATIQVVPHIIDEIKAFILADLAGEDFVICEIGGTVGDIEELPFLEAIRQLSNDLGRENTLFIHLTLLPYIAAAGELKTKPTQHSVKALLSFGIQPDILLCRSDRPIPAEAKRKLGLFCNVRPERVIEAQDVATIYQVPVRYHQEGLDLQVCRYFGLEAKDNIDLSKWHTIGERICHPDGQVNIAIVGKYVQLLDAYKSVAEALAHGGIANNVKVCVHWLDAEHSSHLEDELMGMHGVLVPGGFGERGIGGKLKAIQVAREKNIPFLGICFGMQLAVIEAARNLLGLQEASSTEFGATPEPVIGIMTEWEGGKTRPQHLAKGDLGGTMRVGSYPCLLEEGSLAHRIYGHSSISERHRHRYEVNMAYRERLEEVGLHFSGLSLDKQLPEILERRDHPWFVGVQFHPELTSRPFHPHPLFVSFIAAALQQERLV